jgi:hypothetical protein
MEGGGENSDEKLRKNCLRELNWKLLSKYYIYNWLNTYPRSRDE